MTSGCCDCLGSDGRVSWSVQLGDVSVTISGAPGWAHTQRALLGEFLAGPVGRADLGHLYLHVDHNDHQLARYVAAANRSEARRRVTIPGVTMLEVDDGAGSRILTVETDALEDDPGSYAVRVTGDSVELVIGSRARHGDRLALRVLREAMIRTYENAGATLLHAAGAVVYGVGVGVCGPRAAGKTTTLAALLHGATAGGLLSNDRLLVTPPPVAGGVHELIAVPLPVPLARGTLEAWPVLDTALARTHGTRTAAPMLPREFGATTKSALSAGAFAAAIGARLVASAPLELLIVPRLTDDHTQFAVRSMSASDACRQLLQSCFTPIDEFWRDPWLIAHRDSATELTTRSRHHLAAVSRTVPAVQIQFGVRNRPEQLVAGLAATLARTLEGQA